MVFSAAWSASAQGTAISYQGRLFDGGAPANTNYDLRFAVYDAVTNGNRISGYVTNSTVPVTNGLFNVTLDFGPGVFNGTANGSNDWLDVSVRAIGAGNFTALNPRQPILPVPYALFATSASNLLGTVPSSELAGSYTNTVNFSNSTNTFAGTFSGNGASLTNLNATNITSGTLADARLSTNVALLNATQTFTGPKTFAAGNTFSGTNTFSGPVFFTGTNVLTGSNSFTGVNIFTNNGNYFQGSFFGNGLVGWLAVNGTVTNAMRDAGYLMLNSAFSSNTLPASASLLVGDIVRISGGGTGGWLMKQNASQYITGPFASYSNVFLATLPTTDDYHGVAAAADGVRMYAVGNGFNGVKASSDGGQTWAVNTPSTFSIKGYAVACSANGKIVYMEPYSGGNIYKSTDYGVTFVTTNVSATSIPIACSADGNNLFTGVACSGNGTYQARVSGSSVQVSSNGGTSWNTVTSPGTVNYVGASSDCSKLLAVGTTGLIYVSANMGMSWSALSSTNQYWTGAWMSPDGSKFAATTGLTGSIPGGIERGNVSALPNTSTTPGVNGSLSGSQGCAVELQYIGNNQFVPVSSSGLIWAN